MNRNFVCFPKLTFLMFCFLWFIDKQIIHKSYVLVHFVMPEYCCCCHVNKFFEEEQVQSVFISRKVWYPQKCKYAKLLLRCVHLSDQQLILLLRCLIIKNLLQCVSDQKLLQSVMVKENWFSELYSTQYIITSLLPAKHLALMEIDKEWAAQLQNTCLIGYLCCQKWSICCCLIQ